MIVPIIMAIWFGVRASKAGRSTIGWALGGAVLTFIVSTIIANLGILVVSGSLRGPVEVGTYIALRIITAILAIVAMYFIGVAILPAKPKDELATSDSYYAKEPGGAEFLYSIAQLRDGYQKGQMTSEWTVRRDEETEPKPIEVVLGLKSQTEHKP